jgi:hypothetical protein
LVVGGIASMCGGAGPLLLLALTYVWRCARAEGARVQTPSTAAG